MTTKIDELQIIIDELKSGSVECATERLEEYLDAAVKAERQACLDICDAEAEKWQSPKYHYAMAAAVHCARKIKDRNQ